MILLQHLAVIVSLGTVSMFFTLTILGSHSSGQKDHFFLTSQVTENTVHHESRNRAGQLHGVQSTYVNNTLLIESHYHHGSFISLTNYWESGRLKRTVTLYDGGRYESYDYEDFEGAPAIEYDFLRTRQIPSVQLAEKETSVSHTVEN